MLNGSPGVGTAGPGGQATGLCSGPSAQPQPSSGGSWKRPQQVAGGEGHQPRLSPAALAGPPPAGRDGRQGPCSPGGRPAGTNQGCPPATQRPAPSLPISGDGRGDRITRLDPHKPGPLRRGAWPQAGASPGKLNPPFSTWRNERRWGPGPLPSPTPRRAPPRDHLCDIP